MCNSKEHLVSQTDLCRQKWSLENIELLASTFTSHVYKAKQGDHCVVLKILNEKGKQSEVKGASVLRCFDGNGAIRLLDADEGAHLLEYVDGQPLKNLVASGKDARATDIACEVIEKLHSYTGPIPEELISMAQNFRSLFVKAKSEPLDSLYAVGARLAEKLLENEQETNVLHGDLHHENVLESSQRGWLAIDPQCLVGERTYDLANMFYNPNGFTELAASEKTVTRRCDLFSRRLKIDRHRILEYAFVYGCLSATWFIEDGQDPSDTLLIANRIYGLLRNQ